MRCDPPLFKPLPHPTASRYSIMHASSLAPPQSTKQRHGPAHPQTKNRAFRPHQYRGQEQRPISCTTPLQKPNNGNNSDMPSWPPGCLPGPNPSPDPNSFASSSVRAAHTGRTTNVTYSNQTLRTMAIRQIERMASLCNMPPGLFTCPSVPLLQDDSEHRCTHRPQGAAWGGGG